MLDILNFTNLHELTRISSWGEFWRQGNTTNSWLLYHDGRKILKNRNNSNTLKTYTVLAPRHSRYKSTIKNVSVEFENAAADQQPGLSTSAAFLAVRKMVRKRLNQKSGQQTENLHNIKPSVQWNSRHLLLFETRTVRCLKEIIRNLDVHFALNLAQ